MPLGQRPAHMAPEGRLRIRDQHGECVVGAGRRHRSQLVALEQAQVRGRKLGPGELDEDLAQFAGELPLA